MTACSIEQLKALTLPEIPPDFFQAGTFEKRSKYLPKGTIVCIQKQYYDRGRGNPERVWGYVRNIDDEIVYVSWANGASNSYRGGCLCTLEEFMSEHGNALPFSWRT